MRAPLVEHEARHLEHRPHDAHAELLVLGRCERPVHQRAEVVGRVPGLPGVLALDQLRRGREQLAVARAQVVEARPGQEVRALGADRVVGAERVGAEQPADQLVGLPERQVGRAVDAQPGERHAAEQNVEHERPVVAHRDRDQPERPQELRRRRGPGLDHLPHLVDLVRERGVSDPHAQLLAREARCDGADLDSGKRLAEQLVVRALDLEDLGNGLEQEARLERLQLLRQPPPVVCEAHDIPHDARRPLPTERLRQARPLATDAVRSAREVERHDAHAERLEPRAELHGLARADDAGGARDDERAAIGLRPEHALDESVPVHRQRAPAEDAEHAS